MHDAAVAIYWLFAGTDLALTLVAINLVGGFKEKNPIAKFLFQHRDSWVDMLGGVALKAALFVPFVVWLSWPAILVSGLMQGVVSVRNWRLLAKRFTGSR